MSSSADAPQPRPTLKGSGLLLTHDWTQLHTPHGLLDPTETIPVEDSDYKTVRFPISSVSQFQACVSGKMFCSDLQCVKGCPLEFESSSSPCRSGSEQPITAVVKVTYKVSHKLLVGKNRVLCKNAKYELYKIMDKVLQENENVQEDISAFLLKFGSHFQSGNQSMGKAFVQMVVVEEKCDARLLNEIAEMIFAICDEHEDIFTATQEGSWYNPKEFFNTFMWSLEKKQLLKTVRLRISQLGVKNETASLTEWKNSAGDQPQELDGIDSNNIESVWDMIAKSATLFQDQGKLLSTIKEGWECTVKGTRHQYVVIPHDPPAINIPWYHLVKELGMEQYDPCKLSLHETHCLQSRQKKYDKKERLVWQVLEKLMVTNHECRDKEINNYIKMEQDKQPKRQSMLTKFKQSSKSKVIPAAPHPMDVLLLLFTCSDFMLRQVLARKLFLCRLAIPFIIPMRGQDEVEMLIWPLRSIVLEWLNKEQDLIRCKLNMVTFMRCGKTKFSKSKLMNELLSPSSHPTFFHKELPCGNQKRMISNGTVEMSHFLPDGSQQDQFTEPALFFNLRGDACDHPVQHQVLMELPTTVVIFVDIGELNYQRVKQKLKYTITKKKTDVIVVLTNGKDNDPENIEQRMETFCELVDDLDVEQDVVITFETEGGQRNISDVNQEIKEAIARKMSKERQQSMESITTQSFSQCIIDEMENHHCGKGKKVAEELLVFVKELDACERKEKLLPHQGDCLHAIGKLLRQLHRSSSKGSSTSDKEEIKQRITDIRQEQSATSNNDQFVMKVISLFHNEENVISFAIRWIKLELDAISRAVLPELQADRNNKWNTATKARNENDTALVVKLEHQVEIAERKLAGASFGLEHLMREMGQLYEVSHNLHMLNTEGSIFDISKLPNIVGRQLLDGHPVELMDGDHGIIPIEWVKAVFHSLAQLAGKDKKIFVLSIMGIQSSGKSTLLNTMFGLEFAVSAGRCTRGIYAQLLPVAERKDLPFDYILVLDSEGLKSQELESQNFEHDNELATLVIGLADLALINIKGENARDITDILQIVVYAFLRMKLADSPHKRQCMFIHQNISAPNAQDKLTRNRQKLLDELDRMAQEVSIAHGLTSETISSFNQIISFDCHKDTVYFSDLWNGNPPMAAVNQGYSTLAANTRDSMLKQIPENFKGFITITDFISRIADMWKGVLTDDFIFSFRNTLAAKAYIEMERESARLTFEAEEDLLHWMNTSCNVEMAKTQSEDELHQCHKELQKQLMGMVATLITQKSELLENFIVKHPASEIIMQWKSEKLSSFTLYCKRLGIQREADIENMKLGNLFRIRQGSEADALSQEIIRRAISVAEDMQSQCSPDDNELKETFEDLWKKWEANLVSTSSKTSIDALSELYAILWEESYYNMRMYFEEHRRHNPHVSAEGKTAICQENLHKDHIMAKYCSVKGKNETENKRSKYLGAALQSSNAMLQSVMKEVEAICRQDIMFNAVHGRHILTHLFKEIEKHNELSFDKVEYTFTPEFKAMMAIHVACCAAPMFDCMSHQFEERHGVHAQVQAYKDRVFLRFKNTVRNTNAEKTASEDFCAALKGPVKAFVQKKLDQNMTAELYHAVGNTKYDLIVKMLDGIAQINHTEEINTFNALIEYVTNPLNYAKEWLKMFSDKMIFGHANEQSKYSKVAGQISGMIFVKILSCTSAATRRVTTVDKTDQYNTWITAFCENIRDTLPMDPDKLRVKTNITSFENFQNFLHAGLKRLQTDVKDEFSQVDELSVKWLDKLIPHQKVLKRLWGCTELCPFCREPCQDSDADHTSSHRCVQHKPTGIRGTRCKVTNCLILDPCNSSVSQKKLAFGCIACNKQCRSTKHCDATGDTENYHSYLEYKKFLPDWDIAPDPAGTASKYWQWAMCTFQTQLLEYHQGTKLVIPESWKEITSKDARDSLRLFAM